MTAPKILVSEAPKPARSPLVAAPDVAWRLLGYLGFVFALVGGLDVALIWYPLNFGSPEWEFGTVTASLDGLPLPVMGMALVLASAVARGVRWPARIVAILLAALATLILAGGILYLTDVPIALLALREQPVARQGVMKALVKTSLQLTAYPAVMFWIAAKAWAHTRTRP
ncbi:MAG: hypothetical protein HYR48_01155 [Gemmatimonadetes bacterium]|nr:hypothetical protein [Gemmatimonadota bacterium]